MPDYEENSQVKFRRFCSEIAVAPPIMGLFLNSATDYVSGLNAVFLVSAVATALAFVLILTIPAVSMDEEVPDTVTV